MGKNNRKNYCDNLTTMSSPMTHEAKESLRQLYRVGNFESLPFPTSLQWRHNERDGVSNQQPRHCLLSRIFRHRSKKTSSNGNICRVTDLLCGEFTSHWWIPVTKASDAENVSIQLRHHVWPSVMRGIIRIKITTEINSINFQLVCYFFDSIRN